MRYLFSSVMAAAALLMITAQLRATDEAIIPPSAVSDQTVMVGQLDVSSITIDDLKATLKALMGDQASIFDQQMPDVEKMRSGFTNAGGRALGIVANVGDSGMPEDEPIIIVQPKAGADMSGLQSWTNDQIHAVNGRPVLTQRDGYLTLTQQQMDLPSASSGRYSELTAKLSQLPAGSGKLVFIPTDAMRQAMAAQMQAGAMPPQFAPAVQLLLNAKWLGLSAGAGDKPTTSLVIEMPNAQQAQQMAQFWAGMSVMAAQAIAGQYSRTGMEPPDPTQLMQKLAMKQDGTMLTLTLDTPTLATIAKPMAPALIAARTAAKRVAVMSNMRQMSVGMMMYAQDNNGQWPDNLNQLAPYMGGPEQFKQLMTHPVTKANPGFVYVKPAAKLSDVPKPGQTVVLYEAGPDGQANPNGAKGFADGHVEAPHPTPPAMDEPAPDQPMME